MTTIQSADETRPYTLTIVPAETPAFVAIGVTRYKDMEPGQVTNNHGEPVATVRSIAASLSIKARRLDVLSALVVPIADAGDSGPVARVEQYLSAYAAPGADYIDGYQGAQLTRSDLRDTLGELSSWYGLAVEQAGRIAELEQLAESRLKVADALAAKLADLLQAAKNVSLGVAGFADLDETLDELADAVLSIEDPAPQGEKITAEDD